MPRLVCITSATIQPDPASCSYLKPQMCIQMMDHCIKEVGVYLGKSNTGKTTCLLLTKQLVGREFAIKAPNNYFTSGQRDAQQADSHLAQVDGKRFWYSEELPKEGTLQVRELFASNQMNRTMLHLEYSLTEVPKRTVNKPYIV